ncbi:MAG: hypothetical protein A2284_08145 [Deltaproteobacteria bacterium RIFOXYA12_FULL_61_11]|nr:MAG: hypothetical protein A2284_08145 [Deltaproteobacteria bacterium RIFOXYA12_FULL_61_11]
MIRPLLVFLLLPLGVSAYQNRVDLLPGYSASFYNDVGLSTIDGIYGPIWLAYFEYDGGNRLNLVAEFAVTRPEVLGDSGTFDDEYYFLDAGLGFKYYPRLRDRTDFRQLGDTSVLITSHYSLNPFVGMLANAEVFLEDSHRRRQLLARYPDNPNVFMRGNRLFLGANLVTGTDWVLGPSWGLTFLLRYQTIKSLYKVNSSDLLVMGLSLHAGVYYNF